MATIFKDLFLARHSIPLYKLGVVSKVQKVFFFTCDDNVAKELGIQAASLAAAPLEKLIAAYNRTATRMGDVVLNPRTGTGTTIAVSEHYKERSAPTTYHGHTATILQRLANPESLAKGRKPHRTGVFAFPGSCTKGEITATLSALFLKFPSVLGSSTGTTPTAGVILPYYLFNGRKRVPLLTNKDQIVALEAKYGVEVATTVAEAEALLTAP